MKCIGITLLVLITLCAYNSIARADPLMAFGYLANTTSDENYEYLETIFPNSFANSLGNIFDVNIMKPYEVDKELQEEERTLQKNYEPYELEEIVDILDADYFIFGNFTPMANNRIKIELHFYEQGSNKVFTFTNTGTMETEIFKLVDRITVILADFMSDEQIYKTKRITAGSNLAILTNLQGTDLNQLYLSFLEKKYVLASLSGNTLYNSLSEELIEQHKYITTEANAMDIITDRRNIKFLHGTWTSKKFNQQVQYQKKVYNIYDFKFLESKNRILSKLNKVYGNNIDYLLIIGFNDNDEAWIRCIDMRSKDLVWMQSDISGSDPTDVGNQIIELMQQSPRELHTSSD